MWCSDVAWRSLRSISSLRDCCMFSGRGSLLVRVRVVGPPRVVCLCGGVVVAMMVFVEAEVLACLLGRQQGCRFGAPAPNKEEHRVGMRAVA